MLYVVDKRQELHFVQVFRCAKKTGIVRPETELNFLGFGTMNGRDGKPFKTRDGGVMRLEYLIREIRDAVYDKMMENRSMEGEEAGKNGGHRRAGGLKIRRSLQSGREGLCVRRGPVHLL